MSEHCGLVGKVKLVVFLKTLAPTGVPTLFLMLKGSGVCPSLDVENSLPVYRFSKTAGYHHRDKMIRQTTYLCGAAEFAMLRIPSLTA